MFILLTQVCNPSPLDLVLQNHQLVPIQYYRGLSILVLLVILLIIWNLVVTFSLQLIPTKKIPFLSNYPSLTISAVSEFSFRYQLEYCKYYPESALTSYLSVQLRSPGQQKIKQFFVLSGLSALSVSLVLVAVTYRYW